MKHPYSFLFNFYTDCFEVSDGRLPKVCSLLEKWLGNVAGFYELAGSVRYKETGYLRVVDDPLYWMRKQIEANDDGLLYVKYGEKSENMVRLHAENFSQGKSRAGKFVLDGESRLLHEGDTIDLILELAASLESWFGDYSPPEYLGQIGQLTGLVPIPMISSDGRRAPLPPHHRSLDSLPQLPRGGRMRLPSVIGLLNYWSATTLSTLGIGLQELERAHPAMLRRTDCGVLFRIVQEDEIDLSSAEHAERLLYLYKLLE